MSTERTEQATPRKRQRAAERGDRARSRELTGSVGMFAGVLALEHIFTIWASEWAAAYHTFLALGATPAWRDGQIQQTILSIRQLIITMLSPLLLMSGAVTGAVLLASVAQGGGLRINMESIQPKWSRLNPLENGKNLFSWRGLTRFGKSLLPAALLLVLAIGRIRQQTALAPLSVVRLPAVFETIYGILLDASLILVVWSAIDYLAEWRGWESRQKMTKQELRDEYRQTEGNPQVRGRIRRLRRQMRRKSLRSDVSRSSVVITNPTHYAVALSFDFETMEPPKVVAKGRNLLAEQIKNDAHRAGVPIVENPPLARSLYRVVEPGQAIPFDLYAAVAAILAYLYRQQVEDRLRRERMSKIAPRANTASADLQSNIQRTERS